MSENKTCFVIMPISESEGYESDHFQCVYEYIFKPAIEAAGFDAKRADDENGSSMIHVNIIRDIIEAPMAICDLSTRNPNVLFELGIRQAFDLPVVLVQEKNTPRIFDISSINTIDYNKDLHVRNVMDDRIKITNAILATKDNTTGINSIIRLLDIDKKASSNVKNMSELDEIRILLMSVSNKIGEISNMIDNKENKKNSIFLVGGNTLLSKLGEDYNPVQNLMQDKAVKLKSLIGQRNNLRVHEVARELGISSSDIIKILNDNNCYVESHMSRLDKTALNILLEYLTPQN